jgi:hypothetical protein
LNIVGKTQVTDRELDVFLNERSKSCCVLSHFHSHLLAHLAESSERRFDAQTLESEFLITLSRPSSRCAHPHFIKADLHHRDRPEAGTFYLNVLSGEFVFQGALQKEAFETAAELVFKGRVQLLLSHELPLVTLDDEPLDHLRHLIEFSLTHPDERFMWGDKEVCLHADYGATDVIPCFHIIVLARDGQSSITHVNPETGEYLHIGALPAAAFTEALSFMMEMYQVKLFEREGREAFREIAELGSNPDRLGDRLDVVKPELVSELDAFMRDKSAIRLERGIGTLKLNLMKCLVAPKLFPALMRHLKDQDTGVIVEDTGELVERLKDEGLTHFTPEDLFRLLSKPDTIVARVSPTDLRLWGLTDPYNPWSPFVNPQEGL